MKIYLDYAATTPVSDEVFNKMRPYFCEKFGNANSVHSFGEQSRTAVIWARGEIAKALGVSRADVFFTSGGSEANNWAIKCATKKKVLISAIEHPSVIESAKQRGNYGVLQVDVRGIVTEQTLEEMLSDDVGLVSVMLVNNEIGTVQNIKRLAEITHARGALFHTDAVQGLSMLKVDAQELGVDMLTISAHKVYGPKGIGALYIKPEVEMDMLIAGGHQERSIRGGTTNTPLIVGFAEALKITERVRNSVTAKMNEIKNAFTRGVVNRVNGVSVNGASDAPNIVNLLIDGVNANKLLAKLDIEGIAASAGSACAAGSVEMSHVLKAIGLTDAQAKSSLRFSFGRDTTQEEVMFAVEKITSIVSKIRKM